MHEFDIMAKLTNGVCPKVFDSFQFMSHQVFTMEYCDQLLVEYLAENKLSFGDKVKVMERLAFIVSVIHEHEYIHTDLKLENIMLRKKNDISTMVVLDFGSALHLDDRRPVALQSRHFRAPEVLFRQNYDQAIDVWSLGCIFYEIITGERLFPAKSDEMLNMQIFALLGFPDYDKMPATTAIYR